MTRKYDLVLEPDLPPVDFPLPDFPPGEDLWIFGYGSLMWRPGFDHNGVEQARLFGYHRAFCVSSVVHRGTRERPGLVLGLDRGGSCKGIAIRCPSDIREPVVDYLYRREMVTSVYVPKTVQLELVGSRTRVEALTFIADPAHEQFYGRPTIEDAAQIIAGAHGRGGPNHEYLQSTVEHLDEMGIGDGPLHAIWKRVRTLNDL